MLTPDNSYEFVFMNFLLLLLFFCNFCLFKKFSKWYRTHVDTHRVFFLVFRERLVKSRVNTHRYKKLTEMRFLLQIQVPFFLPIYFTYIYNILNFILYLIS